MADGLSIEVDYRDLFTAMDRCVDHVERALLANSEFTAERVAAEARRRVRRRTGRTAAGITVERARHGQGFVVLAFDRNFDDALRTAGNDEQPRNLPAWLEFGTSRMTAKPYFFAAAAVEQGPHSRRSVEAVQGAIVASGLGD